MGFLRGDQDSETELYLAGQLLVMVFQLPVMMVSVSVCMDIRYMYNIIPIIFLIRRHF